MTKLPPPKVHFDFLRTSPVLDNVRRILALPPEFKDAIIADVTGELCGSANAAMFFGTTYTMTRFMLMYEREQQQVVCVGPRMQAAFANTSLANVPLDMVRPPYPCFYLAVPESEDLVLWGGARTGWHRVAGMYVVRDVNHQQLSVLAWGEANDRSIVNTDDATFWFSINLDHVETMEDSFERSLDPKYVRRTISTIEEESAAVANEIEAVHALDPNALRRINFDKALDKLLANRAADASDIGMSLYNGNAGTDPERIERVRQTARKLMRIAVNTILYMNSTGADLSEPETNESERARLRKKLAGFKNPNKKDARLTKRKLDELPKSRIVWVGPTIEQEIGGEHDLTESSGRTVSGHVRRGHWHTFLVGPRKREGEVIVASERGRTLKWIPPLWVGGVAKDSAERRIYAVRE